MKRAVVALALLGCGDDELIPPAPDAARVTDAAPGLPDLVVDPMRAAADLALQVETFAADACELGVDDDCAGGPGARTLLRFSVETPNLGDGDLHLGSPVGNDDFTYSECHMHYHLAGYARYELLDAGAVVAAGHKQAFCLEDSHAVTDDAPALARYSCFDQGIQRGWSDVYQSDLPCQFIDVTDVPPGAYTLRVTLDADQRLTELDDANNVLELPVDLADPDLVTPTEPCDGLDAAATSNHSRECGWELDATWTCTPGLRLRIGCAATCDDLGACTGDPMIRACDRAEPAGCSLAAELPRFADQDDACGSPCPRVRDVVCPPSGEIDVFVAPEVVGAAYSCTVEMAYN